MMDAAAVQALVAQVVAQVFAQTTSATGEDRGHRGSKNGAFVHKFYERLEKFEGENWKEWYYQFSVATNTYNNKNGFLLELVEKMEIDEIDTAGIELRLNQEESDWMREKGGDVRSPEFVDQGGGKPHGQELRGQERLRGVEEAL